MKRLISGLTLVGAMAVGTAFGEVNPVPVWPCAEKAAAKAAAELTKGEVACTFDVKFDSLPAGGKVDGLFTLAADKDGVVTLELPAAATAMEGDFRVYSSDKVAKGEWHRVSFNYSILMQRAAFYLDGKLQFENDNIFIPELEFAAPKAGGEFKGEVKNLKVYDIALTTDYLFRGKDVSAKAEKASAQAAAAAKNPALADWAKRIAARAASVNAETTVKEIDEICRDAANAERLAGEKTFGPVAFHQVKPYEQEMFLPYVLPKQGVNDGTLRAYAAGGQEEDASFVVTALKGVKSFTVRASDLVCGNARIPAKDIDVKHVNRWYRAGGAWVSYFLDVRQRILTPHLLVNDDELIRTDELRTRHYFRTNYPEGTKWVDGSDPKKGHQYMGRDIPFSDAATLQPTKQLWEAGRNHQYFVSIWVPRGQQAGLYKGTLDLLADNAKVGTVSVELKVLPFDLPLQAYCYDDPKQPYFTHMNHFPRSVIGYTYAEQLEYVKAAMQNVSRHGMHHCACLYRNANWAKLAKEAGFQTEYVFEVPCPENWRKYYDGVKASDLTDADRELGLRLETRRLLPYDRFYRSFAPNCTPMAIAYSEAGAYAQLNVDQAERAEAAHRLGWKMFAHGGEANLNYAADIQDNNSDVAVKRETAERWHAAGGTVMAYAQPFASPENPAVHRRRLGFERWLGAHYDGNMQHGFDVRDVGYNEFAVDPGGDGNYRCVETAYHDQKGILYGIPWSGVKAAHDDLRYATLMKELATKHLQDKDGDLRGEAKRQLAWLARQNGWNCDMPMMRAALADRIATMLALEQKKGGK